MTDAERRQQIEALIADLDTECDNVQKQPGDVARIRYIQLWNIRAELCQALIASESGKVSGF